jgi:hypothetical protein
MHRFCGAARTFRSRCNQQWYLKFIQEVHDSKMTPGFTNLKFNAMSGLLDLATLTKMCAAALYCELVN